MTRRLWTVLLAMLIVAGAVPTVLDAQHFGRNKVQYRSFDFKVIKTEHFDIHFYPQERQAALDAARIAERSYTRLSRILQHEFEERKPIILYASHSDFQQTNTTPGHIGESTGAFADPLKGRVVIPFTGSYADFERVLTHELVHAFQFDIFFRFGVRSDANPLRARPPLWFMEGMAEYLALGRIDAQTSAWARDAALSGYLRSIAEMSRRDDYLSYRFGQSLWTYIGSKWGDEVIGIILQKAPRMGIERAFASTLGIPLGQLSREWTESVRSTYLPQATEFQRPTEFAKAVARHERLEDPSFLAPAISPDGQTMALFTTREGFFPDLWLADATTGELKVRLVETSREADFESLRYQRSAAAFSPDGRYLAFAAQTGGRDALYIYDLEDRRIRTRLVFELNGILTPTWSPDGSRIAFAGLDGGVSDLYITDLDGELTRLTDDRYTDLFPAWSPDGRAIAFSTDRGDGTDLARLDFSELQVALLHLPDRRIEVLPHQDGGRNLNPVWSPDSRALIWAGDRTGVRNLYLFERDEHRLYRITDLLSGIIGPTATDRSPTLSWARESGKLLFVYFEAAGHSIYAVDDPRALPRTPVGDAPERGAAPSIAAADSADPAPSTAPRTVEAESPPVPDGVAIASLYRTGDSFRPSATMPADAEGGPVSVVALLDSANIALPDTSEFTIEDYSIRLSPDQVGRPSIGAQVGGYYGNGLYGGSYVALSDILGNHRLLLAGNISGSLSDLAAYVGYDYLKQRTNFGVAAQQTPMYRFLGPGQFPLDNGETAIANAFLRDVIRSGQVLMRYPFSTFQRVELGVTGTWVKREVLLRGYNQTTQEPVDESRPLNEIFPNADLDPSITAIRPTVALVFDNALFGWTGPIYGRRYRLQLSQSLGDYRYSEAMVDFRNYLNYDQAVIFAARFVSLMRFGPEADEFPMYWGGGYFLRGYDYESFDAECRGDYTDCPARSQLIGSSAALLNLEVRFPLVTEVQLGPLGNFPPIEGVAFFDSGLAWDAEVCGDPSQRQFRDCGSAPSTDVALVWRRQPGQNPYLVRAPLFSAGVGMRINVFYTVLRLDYAFPLSREDRRGVFSISFGPSF